MSAVKLEQLRAQLRSYDSCLVAYSGGVDSVFLARVAHETLGDRALAVIADSPSLPRRELEEALAIAREFALPVRVVTTDEFANDQYLANPVNRCYFCKHELFTRLEPLARELGFKVIAYGENASDVGDFRPGAQAAAEFQVRAPLKEVGLTKAEIRALSAELGLPTADKPQMACLSSRIPYGEAVTPAKLRMIEQAEYVLRDLGFHDVRVRHHELRPNLAGPKAVETLSDQAPPPNSAGFAPAATAATAANAAVATAVVHLARIEVGPSEVVRLLDAACREQITSALRGFGYGHVTVDLEGYRRGSLNQGVTAVPIQFKPLTARIA